MLPWGYEPSLLKMQLRRGQSIFACDATEVYSSEEMDLGGLVTVDLGIDLHCPLGGVFHTVMNTPIFLQVWKRSDTQQDHDRRPTHPSRSRFHVCHYGSTSHHFIGRHKQQRNASDRRIAQKYEYSQQSQPWSVPGSP